MLSWDTPLCPVSCPQLQAANLAKRPFIQYSAFELSGDFCHVPCHQSGKTLVFSGQSQGDKLSVRALLICEPRHHFQVQEDFLDTLHTLLSVREVRSSPPCASLSPGLGLSPVPCA